MLLNKNELISGLSKIHSYTSAQETYSPFYSTTGIEVGNYNGIGTLHFHYNRASRELFGKFADFPYALNENLSSVEHLVFGDRKAELAFFGTDEFIISCECESISFLSEMSERTSCTQITKKGENVLFFGYSKNPDDRDPDETVPFILGFKAIEGTFETDGQHVFAHSSGNGKITVAVVFEALEAYEESVIKKLENSALSVAEASKKCLQWLTDCIGGISLNVTDKEFTLISKAVHGLVMNLAIGQGNIKKHISSFPNRGSYPTHFLWDSCFQNLAYEELSPFLAKEFLLQFAETQRCDGKFPQFLCSTWNRPHFSQPPLVGWASLRLKDDRDFLEKMLPAIELNNRWWLTQRMTSYGLIACPHGLETGQDDSPRFDDGTTIAADMNSYLLSQMRAAAEISGILGLSEKSAYWRKEADEYARQMVDVLWCRVDNIFYDILVSTGEKVKIISPSALLPLWAGVPLNEKLTSDMIERYLISPEYMFGAVPFPSVAYNEEKYKSDAWWRGPTWMPIAYLMLETLKKYGYEKEYRTAAERLHGVILADGKMHELFDSATGEGLGSAEQGWTCAIFIKLCKIKGEF